MFLNGLNKPSVEINRNVKEDYNVADFIDLPAWLIVVRSYFVKVKSWSRHYNAESISVSREEWEVSD